MTVYMQSVHVYLDQGRVAREHVMQEKCRILTDGDARRKTAKQKMIIA